MSKLLICVAVASIALSGCVVVPARPYYRPAVVEPVVVAPAVRVWVR